MKNKKAAGGVAQVIKHSPSKHKALSSNSSTTQTKWGCGLSKDLPHPSRGRVSIFI
jgi:hypothetical protein